MSVACECADGEWFYEGPDDYMQLDTKRGRRCFSCNTLIKVGEDCGKFYRWRPGDEWNDSDLIKMRVYGDEIPLTTWYACEACAGLYFSITELGFCVMIGDGMTMAENARMTGQPGEWE